MSPLLVSGRVAKIQLPRCYQELAVGTVSYVTSQLRIFTTSKQISSQKNIGSKMCYLLLGWTKCNFSSHVNLIFCAGHQKLKASALYCSVMEKFEIFRKSIQNITGERYLQILPFLTNNFLSSKDRDVGAKPIITLIVDLSCFLNTPFCLRQ